MNKLLRCGGPGVNLISVGRGDHPWIREALVPVFVLVVIAAVLACCTLSGEHESNDKAITAFAFLDPPSAGTISEIGKTITVVVPVSTNLAALVASFTTMSSSVTVDTTVQVSGKTANDFSNPVIESVLQKAKT